jgi:hypothetical protein
MAMFVKKDEENKISYSHFHSSLLEKIQIILHI